MIPVQLVDIESTFGCLGFSFLSINHNGERRTFVFLRDAAGVVQGSLCLRSEDWDGGIRQARAGIPR